jgi:hypothetical protein
MTVGQLAAIVKQREKGEWPLVTRHGVITKATKITKVTKTPEQKTPNHKRLCGL